MVDKIELAAALRTVTGKKVSSLRAEGLVPGVLYGHNTEPVSLSVGGRTLAKVYATAGSNQIVLLSVDDGKPTNVLIHAVQINGRRGDIDHVDFYQVKMDEKIKAEVPLVFVGESTAVYKLEGTLFKNLEALEIEALPGSLPESFEVNIDVLDDFDKAIHVSDLKIPGNVELLTDEHELIAKVEPPRSDEELEALDEAPVEELPVMEGEDGETKSVGEEQEAVVEENEGNKDKQDKGE